MTRAHRSVPIFLLLLAGLLMAVLTPARPAAATTPDDVAADLRRDLLYVDDEVRRTGVDEDRLVDRLDVASIEVYVAFLPDAAVDALGSRQELNGAIGELLGEDAVLITVVDGDLTAGAGCGVGLGGGEADRLVRQTRGSTQSRLLEAIDVLEDETQDGRLPRQCSASGGDEGGGVSGLLLLGVVGAVAVGGGAYLFISKRRREREYDERDRADLEELYARLADEVSTLQPQGNTAALQEIADAAARYDEVGTAMQSADTPGEWASARRLAVEGLTAAKRARALLGLEPGPEIPPPPGALGPQLTQRQTVRVGEAELEGTPEYEPGHAHYWGGGSVGGQQVPGGWYPSRFWEGLLVGGVLGGGYGNDPGRRRPTRRRPGGRARRGGGDWGGASPARRSGGDWGGGSRRGGSRRGGSRRGGSKRGSW